MPARTTRRRHHQYLARISAMDEVERKAEARRKRDLWHGEIRRLLREQGNLAVKEFLESPARQEEAARLDPSGALLADLRRAWVDAEAEVVGIRLRTWNNPKVRR